MYQPARQHALGRYITVLQQLVMVAYHVLLLHVMAGAPTHLCHIHKHVVPPVVTQPGHPLKIGDALQVCRKPDICVKKEI